MVEEMRRYVYDGPVMEFNKCIAHKWHGETMAVSNMKARSNLIYQFKKATNRSPRSTIIFTGEVKEVIE